MRGARDTLKNAVPVEERGSAREHNSEQRTLRAKLLRVMLSIVVPLSLLTLTGVAFMQYRVSARGTEDVQKLIREGIRDKGRVLTKSHARSLAGLVADNAFGDVQDLVERTVEEDPDIIYGLFLASDGSAWAYVSPATPAARGRPELLKRFTELGVAPRALSPSAASERQTTLFGQHVLEFTAPVLDQGESLGTVRYGLSTARLGQSLALARERAQRSYTTTLLALAVLALLNIALGVVLIGGAARRISQPLSALTEAARAIAEGRRDTRVTVESGDEIERLAAAFNHMLEVNQRTFEQLEDTTERALEASRLKSEFLANMSHEIRTPMNGVMGMTKLLLRLPLEGKQRRYAETIDSSATALLTIINDVLDFSKMEAGKYELHPARFEPRVLVQEVCELLAPRAAERGLELVYRVDPAVPYELEADPDRLRQILNNLVGNAIKFTERGELFVDLTVQESQGDELVLKANVNDTGIGIAERDLVHIFDAFSQVDGSLVRKQGGTGLGLAISRRLAEMMGGAIGVVSALGIGSQFWFTVRAKKTEQAEHTMSGKLAVPIGRRALVVEASHRGCEVIREHLKAWGVESECAQSGEQALSLLSRESEGAPPFDVAVLGTQTGQVGVRELIHGIKERAAGRPLPLILLHPLSKAAGLRDLEAEVDAQLNKPLRMSDLYNALLNLLAGTKPEAKRRDERPSQPPRRSTKKVLVVDDNEVNRLVAVEQLTEFGIASDVACDGVEAVDMVLRGDYALVLMDCQMPVKDGYTATREIRQHEQSSGRHQPIVALTAHAMAGERERVLTAGMDDYLSKPVRTAALERVLARYARPEESIPSVDSAPAQAPEHPAAARAASLEPPPPERPVLALDVARSPALIAMCLREAPKQLAQVEEALVNGAAPALRAAAHKLKGTAMAIAADSMAAVAERLQHCAERALLEEAAILVEQLGGEYLLVEEALQREQTARASA